MNNQEPIPDFGMKLKLARIKRRIKQVDLAKNIGVAHSTISLWESNKRKPDIVNIWKLVWELEIQPNVLIPSPPQVGRIE